MDFEDGPRPQIDTRGSMLRNGRIVRFTRNHGITEGFHNRMELINRQAYGFRKLPKLQTQCEGIVFLELLSDGFAPLLA
jgi:hypothetical protein